MRRVCERIVLACVLASCGRGPDASPDRDASSGEPVVEPDASIPDPPFQFGDGGQAPRDSSVPQPPLDAGDPPVRTCADDAGEGGAGDGGGCSLPSSVCADALWLVYYVGGACVGGICHWEKRFLYCGGNCVNGGCRILGTPPVPR